MEGKTAFPGTEGIRIGFAKADISPCVKTGEGFRRPLETRCAAIAARNFTSVIISCDLIELDPDYNRTLQEAVSGILKIPADNVLIHTTHTHTSPWLRGEGGIPVLAGLDKILSMCALDALSAAVPCRVKSGRTDAGKRLNVNRRGDAGPELGIQTYWFGYRYDPATDRADASPLVNEMRRRWLGEKPESVPGPEPVWFDGPVDQLVQSMLFQDQNGATIGSIVRFSAHPHIASACRDRLLDPDYPARVRDAIEDRYGGICLFLLGPSANMVPKEHISYYFDQESFPQKVYLGPTSSLYPESDTAAVDEMDRIGEGIAQAAAEGLEAVRCQTLEECRFITRKFRVELDPALIEDEEQKEALQRILEAEYEAFRRAGGPLREIRRLANRMNWLEWAAGNWYNFIARKDRDAGFKNMPLAALRINQTVLVFLHSEIAAETTFALRKAYPGLDLMTVSLTGGCLNYLPPDSFIDEGGYEGRAVLAARGSEEKLRRDAGKLLEELGL
ncbi:MAG: hypothetical protein ACM3WV_01400 [Bacillota bacterium]